MAKEILHHLGGGYRHRRARLDPTPRTVLPESTIIPRSRYWSYREPEGLHAAGYKRRHPTTL